MNDELCFPLPFLCLIPNNMLEIVSPINVPVSIRLKNNPGDLSDIWRSLKNSQCCGAETSCCVKLSRDDCQREQGEFTVTRLLLGP